jgi:putative ABC transport system ATP-binding protein
MALIELKNISKYYGEGERQVTALENISIQINKGEFVAIAGPSGSGKSTLMNMIGCIDTQSNGEYYLDGTNITDMSDDELSEIRNKKIGFIFQGFNLISNLTAAENVELPLIYRGISKPLRKELSKKALEKVSLSHRLTHRPSQMSGGQQQRVAIARAIAAEPPIILADEPTGNLDSRSGKEVMRILYDLNSQGKTIILITHDDTVAAKAARVIRISDGVIESDTVNS